MGRWKFSTESRLEGLQGGGDGEGCTGAGRCLRGGREGQNSNQAIFFVNRGHFGSKAGRKNFGGQPRGKQVMNELQGTSEADLAENARADAHAKVALPTPSPRHHAVRFWLFWATFAPGASPPAALGEVDPRSLAQRPPKRLENTLRSWFAPTPLTCSA